MKRAAIDQLGFRFIGGQAFQGTRSAIRSSMEGIIGREIPEGSERKRSGQKTVLENVGEAWKAEALEAVRKLAAEPNKFTVDDLHPLLKSQPHHPNAFGALMGTAQRKGIIRRVGWAKSERREARARMIPVYVGVAA